GCAGDGVWASVARRLQEMGDSFTSRHTAQGGVLLCLSESSSCVRSPITPAHHSTTRPMPPLTEIPPPCRRCLVSVKQRGVEQQPGMWRIQLLASVLCAVFAIAGWLSPWPAVSLVCYLAAYGAGAWFAMQETWQKLRRMELDVDFLMLAVASGAAAIGQWPEGAVLLFLFSFAGALEHFAMARTQREIQALFHAAPKTATALDPDGSEREIAVEQLIPGMRLRVKPGTLFPVDAEIVKGETACDESNLTGEATPVEKRPGDAVLAGTMNLWGAVEATTSRTASESALTKIITLIREAQQQKAPAQRFTDKFGSRYTLGILALTTVMFLIWWLVFDYSPFLSTSSQPSAFYRAMTLLVVASPCALVLSIPSAILAAIAWGARRGVLFRGGVAVEQLAEVDVVAMDKTGTLTTGELRVEDIESFPPGREREVAELTFALERLSTHPLARAVTKYGRQAKLPVADLENFTSVTGMGLEALLQGKPVWLGRRSWVLEQCGATAPPTEEKQFGVSEVWLARGDLLGRVRLRDDIRPQSREMVDQLRARGLHPLVLTGDRKHAANFLREQLGIEDVRAELKPDQKLEIITALAAEGRKTAMIGDGVNDAPGLAAAHVGVAMGARGSDAALEQADVVLMHDRLENFLAAYDLSRRARTIVRQNLTISLGVILLLVSFALASRIPLTLGVLGHEGSTVIVVLNSLRLLFTRSPILPGADKKSFH
ncbi:MAG: heavy metal translocating P-type ATPase, partial [Verrucomicrobiaceae bacterium]